MTFQPKLIKYLQEIELNFLTLHSLSYKHDCKETQNAQNKLEIEEKICGMIAETEHITKALNAAQKAECESLDNVKDIYRQTVAKEENKKKKNQKLSKQYRDFEKQLLSIAENAVATKNMAVDSTSTAPKNCVVTDEFIMESEINVFDPMTKKRMENPVRNTQCGHHYEKSSILEGLRQNPRLRCPVAGCGNKNFINARTLADDPQFKASLQEALMLESENDE